MAEKDYVETISVWDGDVYAAGSVPFRASREKLLDDAKHEAFRTLRFMIAQAADGDELPISNRVLSGVIEGDKRETFAIEMTISRHEV